jgi:Holliday junction resolvasome RuvABC DNA-binding subunit
MRLVLERIEMGEMIAELDGEASTEPAPAKPRRKRSERPSADAIDEAVQALKAIGHSDADARHKIDGAIATGQTMKTAQDILQAVYAVVG